MLRSRLMWRMIAPVLLLSLVVLLSGAASAWYVHAANAAVSESLDRYLAAVIASQELVLAVRDTRLELDRYQAVGDPALLETALANRVPIQNALDRTSRSLGSDTALAEQITAAQASFFRRLAAVGQAPPAGLPEEMPAWRQELTERVLAPAEQLRAHTRDLAEIESSRNRVMAHRIGLGLIVLGFCGAAAGVLAGHGIARAVTRSLEQLGGSVREIAGTLDQLDRVDPAKGVHDLPELHSTMQRLADKTATVVQELQETRQHAERSGQLAAIGQFAAALAHELRNPLTSIKLLVQSAGERQAGLIGRDLEVLEEEIVRLERLLQTFLDFARPPTLQKQPVDVWELIRETADFARRRGQQYGVRIACEPPRRPVLLEADLQQLRQVLLNLLLNAIDAQPRGGLVTVACAVDQPDGSEAVIEVSDLGPGLPAELGEQIFEPFVSTKETGMGLGLSICRRIVESHGGSIHAENSPDLGAVFHVRLPLHEPGTATDAADPKD